MITRSRIRTEDREAGFTLVEPMVAMVVFLFGSLAVAQLIGVTAQMHGVSQNSTRGTHLAQQKVDELMKLDFDVDASVQISPAGTLTADTLNYVDNPSPANVIRWQVQAGPTANTRRVTVRVISGQGSMSQRELDLTTVIRQW